jgi:hypothetical protein
MGIAYYPGTFFEVLYSQVLMHLGLKWVLTLGGVLEDAKRMCNVDTIEEQDRIWREKVYVPCFCFLCLVLISL